MKPLIPYKNSQSFLKQFNILGIIGKGGMATVYEIEHIDSGKRVALKLLDFSKANGWDSEEEMEFRREAEALRSIDHPNVVGYGHSFLENIGGYGQGMHLLIELIRGASL